MTVQPPEPRPIRLLVNAVTGRVHRPQCEHARGCIPWVWPAKSASDRACKVCAPVLAEREEE